MSKSAMLERHFKMWDTRMSNSSWILHKFFMKSYGTFNISIQDDKKYCHSSFEA